MTSTTDPPAPGGYSEHWAPRGEHRIYLRDYPGEEPAVVLMHGFPDNLHLYDRLVARMNPPRRLVTFDFLGWGRSDKPAGYPYTAANQPATWMPPSCIWGLIARCSSPTMHPARPRSTGHSTTPSGCARLYC